MPIKVLHKGGEMMRRAESRLRCAHYDEGMERADLRATFDEDAELYDRARPGYPIDLIDDLCMLAGIVPGARVLEIGPGTGKATIPLAERGSSIVAIELGSNLADVARRNLAGFPSASVIVSSFEDWPLPLDPFDAVVLATAWHWIDSEVRVTKSADALRMGGALALVATHHVAGGDNEFFLEVQECYEQWDPATPPGLRLPTPGEIPAGYPDLEASNRFAPPIVRRYEQDIVYSTRSYLDVLLTYSGHRALEIQQRARLLDCIARLIDSRYSGKIAKRYLYELAVARRIR